LRGENLKIETGKLEDFSLKIAVKPKGIFKLLTINKLQNGRKNNLFCQNILPILPVRLSIYFGQKKRGLGWGGICFSFWVFQVVKKRNCPSS
jgi:hypothetical protein